MQKSDNSLIITFNAAGVFIAYAMLGLSLWMAPVNIATKGYWAIGILFLSLSLVNFVKYRFDDRLREDRIQRLEEAKNEKLLETYVTEKEV